MICTAGTFLLVLLYENIHFPKAKAVQSVIPDPLQGSLTDYITLKKCLFQSEQPMQYDSTVATTELDERGCSRNFIANSPRPDSAHVSNHLTAYILEGPNALGTSTRVPVTCKSAA